MFRNIHAHIPYLRLFENLEYFLRKQINPEVYFSCEALDSFTVERLGTASRHLQAAGLSTTIHAAFLDLNPGALDTTIREATRQRFQQVFQTAEILKPKVIVFHPGYDELRYGSSREAWLDNSISFWREFVPRAEAIGTVIAVENIFEKEPSTLRELLESIAHPSFRHCFDVGHWNMFATGGLEEWFVELGRYMAEMHIHDNSGRADEHLPLGEGKIDFDLYFSLVKRHAPDAVWTIEAHTIERLERAFANISQYLQV